MAGKVKNKDDGQTSKTARASMRGGPSGKESYIPSADCARIVPLGGGTHVYVLDPRDGRTLRLEVKSERFVEMLCALVEAGQGDRMRRDLADLVTRFPACGWDAALARLDAALAPPAEAAEAVA